MERVKSFLKELIKLFSVRQPLLIIWLIIIFLFNFIVSFKLLYTPFFSLPSFIFTNVISSIFTILFWACVVLSPAFEWILLQLDGARRVATLKEKKRLLPLFEEVKKDLQEHNLRLKNVKLYIIDSLKTNAYSYNNAVVLYRGLIDTVSDEELKAVIAHELAHILYDDTKTSVLIMFATNFSLTVLLLVSNFIKFLARSVSINGDNFISLFFDIIAFIVGFIPKIVINLWLLIFFWESRRQEYRADGLSSELYNEGMLKFLYRLYAHDFEDRSGIKRKLEATHPIVAFRIERIEQIN